MLAVTLACGLAYAARNYPEGPSQLAVYPALWTVAVSLPRRQAWLAAAVSAVAAAAIELFLYGDTMFDGEPLYVAVTVLAAMWWGEAVRARRAYVAEYRTGPSGPSGPGRRRRAAGSTRSGCGSPGSCTTWSPTPSG